MRETQTANGNPQSAAPEGGEMLLSEDQIGVLFDQMADEYDQIKDVWYAWLFSRLHYLLVTSLGKFQFEPKKKCLDGGCGTGFQSILLSLCGHHVEGIDLSPNLIEKARRKNPRDFLARDLFESPFRFGSVYSRRIRKVVESVRGSRAIGKTHYQVASASQLPFESQTFDLVNCCGSTLSFVEEYGKALWEIARVLRPGGLVFIEVENKYNWDLLWPVIDSCLLGDRLGYEQGCKHSLENLLSRRSAHVKIDFPFTSHTGEISMPIWLFSAAGLIRELKKRRLTMARIHGIHNVTNILPSVTLDEPNPSKFFVNMFLALSRLEEVIGSWPLMRRFGCSVVLIARKE